MLTIYSFHRPVCKMLIFPERVSLISFLDFKFSIAYFVIDCCQAS